MFMKERIENKIAFTQNIHNSKYSLSELPYYICLEIHFSSFCLDLVPENSLSFFIFHFEILWARTQLNNR